jgi:hypothetical protein
MKKLILALFIISGSLSFNAQALNFWSMSAAYLTVLTLVGILKTKEVMKEQPDNLMQNATATVALGALAKYCYSKA